MQVSRRKEKRQLQLGFGWKVLDLEKNYNIWLTG